MANINGTPFQSNRSRRYDPDFLGLNSRRTGELTVAKPHPVAAHETPDWLKAAKDAFDPTDDLESLFTLESPAPKPNPSTEVGLDSETLHGARSRALTFAPRGEMDGRAWVESQEPTATAVVENFFRYQQAVIQIGEREYQVCDMAAQDAFAVKFEINDNRRFATCGCGAGEMCIHIKAALILHLTLSDARKNMPPADALLVAYSISLETWLKAGQTPFRGVKQFAQIHNRRLVAEHRQLTTGVPF